MGFDMRSRKSRKVSQFFSEKKTDGIFKIYTKFRIGNHLNISNFYFVPNPSITFSNTKFSYRPLGGVSRGNLTKKMSKKAYQKKAAKYNSYSFTQIIDPIYHPTSKFRIEIIVWGR
jgi:hypothetical protein